MVRAVRHLVLLALALCAAGAQADSFRGVVSHVTDGDSVWVRPAGQREAVEIRLLDIDAPEGCQAHGREAKEALAARVLRQTVVVRTRGRDDYGRTLARLRHRNEDVGAWLVREGHAWSPRYRGRAGRHHQLQEQARRDRAGLWAASHPQEPRSFRRAHGRCE